MEIIELQPEETLLRGVSSQTTGVDVSTSVPPVRSPGLHVSGIIRDLENTVTKPGQRRPYDELAPAERKRMGGYVEAGWAWEEIIRQAMLRSYYGGVDRFVAPGEIELDGIYGTPDWYDLDDECVEEFKATYRSSRRPIERDFWSWFVQVRAYCKMTETRWARLRVFFVNGNYRESGPQFKLWQIRFEDDELDNNWQMLKRHGEAMLERRITQ